MYGLVNKAVQGFVTSSFGQETWERIRQEAGVQEVAFVGMNPYPDEVTYNLVGAGSKVLGLPAEQILEAFGIYYMTFSAKEGYGPMLKMMGDNLPEFLHNLNPMHERLKLTFPKLKPPLITVTDETPNSLHVHYHSDRPALAPFVVGLLKGLGQFLSVKIAVTQVQRKGVDGDHDVFLVRYGSAVEAA